MAYRICYSPEFNTNYPVRRKRKRINAKCLLLTVFALSLVVGICLKDRIKEWLIPNADQAEAAFSVFTRQIREGEPLQDALTTFCLEILSDAHENP